MQCFLCKKKFTSVNVLILHLKKIHALKSNSIYRCWETSCQQIFSNLGSFKKHILRKHVNQTCSDANYHLLNTLNSSATEINQIINSKDNDKDSANILHRKEIKYINKFNEDAVLAKVTESVAQFALNLHNNNNISRKNVTQIQESMTKLIIEPLLEIFTTFVDFKLDENSKKRNDFFSFLSRLRSTLKYVNTEYNLKKWLKNNNYINDINEFTIDHEITSIHQKGHLVYGDKKVTGVVMPLRFQFKKYFEKNGFLRKMLDYMTFLQNKSTFTNFLQGQLWRKKSQLYPTKILIPYFLYIDDFEINNALGSHSNVHSICNVYYSFPCFPEDESKVANVFLAATIKSEDIKCFGNKKVFDFLIKELIYLEVEGINIEFDENSTSSVCFIMCLVHGDNLGLNSMLDFSKSFSSNYCCRFCKIRKEDLQKGTSENIELMRTINNYDDDVRVNDFQSTGIIQESTLNNLPSFHVIENYYVDVMQDVFEGICHYDLSHAITYFINKMKYFDLNTLNHRKRTFEYGATEIQNLSGDIKLNHLQNKHLKMSAREMMTFIMYFSLMVGDLIPSDDEVWKFIINLIEIIDILLCFETTEINIMLLEAKIKKHNTDFIRLFNDVLKPKFHFLTHYPQIIRQVGPLRKLWCFKFEANHRQFKIYSNCISLKTLAKKYSLKFAYQLMVPENEINKLFELNEKHRILSNFRNIIQEKLNAVENDVELYSSIDYKSIEYKIKDYIAIFNNHMHFYLILNIIFFKNNIMFFCQELKNVIYMEHYIAYEVVPNALGQFEIISPNDIIGPPLHLIETPKGKTMLRVKEYFRATS